MLPGGQAQFVRVPKAGGTLFKIPPDSATTPRDIAHWNAITDPSLLLLADILPTGVFAVTQALQHPNILPIVTSKPFLTAALEQGNTAEQSSITLLTEGLPPLTDADKVLTIAVIGLGPVGLVSAYLFSLFNRVSILLCIFYVSFM